MLAELIAVNKTNMIARSPLSLFKLYINSVNLLLLDALFYAKSHRYPPNGGISVLADDVITKTAIDYPVVTSSTIISVTL